MKASLFWSGQKNVPIGIRKTTSGIVRTEVPHTLAALESLVREERQEIPQITVQHYRYIEGTPRRVATVIRAKGGNICYRNSTDLLTFIRIYVFLCYNFTYCFLKNSHVY